MNTLEIIVPGILNFLFWFLHLNASHRMSMLKLFLLVLTSICPVMNIVTSSVFIVASCIRADSIDNFHDSDSNHFFGFGVEYDYKTISGKILHFITKDK